MRMTESEFRQFKKKANIRCSNSPWQTKDDKQNIKIQQLQLAFSEAMEAVQHLWIDSEDVLFKGPFRITIEVFGMWSEEKGAKNDGDNITKAVLDALQGSKKWCPLAFPDDRFAKDKRVIFTDNP